MVSMPIEAFSLHDNSVANILFDPGVAQLRVVMGEPIVGAEGKRTLVFNGVSALSITGSTTGGRSEFLPGDEVLSLVTEQQDGADKVLMKVRFLLSPIPNVDQRDTGLSVIEVVAQQLRLEE